MMLHPDAERLIQFASGATPEGEEPRLSRHLAECDRCRREVVATREVQELLRQPLMLAPEALLSRVIDSRATRELVFLPTGIGSTSPRPDSRRRMLAIIGTGIAATILVTMIPQSVGRYFWNGATTDVAPAPWPVDPARVKPIKLIYDRWRYPTTGSKDDGEVHRIQFSLEETHYAAETRARLDPPWTQWFIGHSEGSPQLSESFGVILDRQSLAPVAWDRRTDRIFDKVYSGKKFYLHGADVRMVSYQSEGTPHTFTKHDTTVRLVGAAITPVLINDDNLIALFMALPLNGVPPKAMRVGAMTGARALHLVASDFTLAGQAIDSIHGKTVTYLHTTPNTTTSYTIRVSDGVLLEVKEHDSANAKEMVMRLVSARFQPMN